MLTSVLLIQAARRLLVRAHREIDAGYGLSMSDTSLLLSLHTRPGATVNELALLLSRDKTTISRTIARLLENGMVRDEIDSLDGRRKNLFLTDQGRRSILSALDSLEDDMEVAAQIVGNGAGQTVASVAGNLVALSPGR